MARYETYGKVDVEQALKVMFAMPSYLDYYSTISRKYKDFEFTDELTDSERLEEYASVYQQFKKFVGSKMTVVLGMQENLYALKEWVGDQIARSDIYPRTRVDMVYNSLKIDWLNKMANQVYAIIEQNENGRKALNVYS